MNNYGPKSNESFLFSYGFILPNNPNNAVSADVFIKMEKASGVCDKENDCNNECDEDNISRNSESSTRLIRLESVSQREGLASRQYLTLKGGLPLDFFRYFRLAALGEKEWQYHSTSNSMASVRCEAEALRLLIEQLESMKFTFISIYHSVRFILH